MYMMSYCKLEIYIRVWLLDYESPWTENIRSKSNKTYAFDIMFGKLRWWSFYNVPPYPLAGRVGSALIAFPNHPPPPPPHLPTRLRVWSEWNLLTTYIGCIGHVKRTSGSYGFEYFVYRNWFNAFNIFGITNIPYFWIAVHFYACNNLYLNSHIQPAFFFLVPDQRSKVKLFDCDKRPEMHNAHAQSNVKGLFNCNNVNRGVQTHTPGMRHLYTDIA